MEAKPARLADVLGPLIAGLAEDRPEAVITEVWARGGEGWKPAWGDPVRLKGGTLTVRVEAPAYHQEMWLRREEIRTALNRALGGERIQKMKFTIGR